ncbi:protein NKG7-like isoform X2 [Heteronotia binoei]|uniref:protein NKG7-like isoform X2 n=1 Tax=Heteronotia binoei TaxID=13085 RepID=UPI0029316BE9|nr:protein NKG7-like isoform X2 [Heteronotia binoei]
MEGIRTAACIFSFVSLLLLIVALATNYWMMDSAQRVHMGLWQACKDNNCASYGMSVSGAIHAVRAFVLMGMVAGAVSFVGLCASFSHTHIGSISIKHLAVSASFVAGFCSMIAMSTFTGVYSDVTLFFGTLFGWSFGLGWASFILFLITGSSSE